MRASSRHDGAFSSLDLEVDPEHVATLHMLGVLVAQTAQRVEEGIKILREATERDPGLEVDPEHVATLHMLGVLVAQTVVLKKALKFFEKQSRRSLATSEQDR